MRFEAKTALVTGASRGIGRAIAVEFAREGADIAVNYVGNHQAAAETVQLIGNLGRKAKAVQADVTKKADVDRLVAEAVRALGRIDILVCNAGTASFKPFLELTESEWRAMVELNMTGSFLVSQAVAREMVSWGGGKIVFVTSRAQQSPLPNLAGYCASKAGEFMLCRAMGLELAKHKINVNCVAPATVPTDFNREALKDPDINRQLREGVPWGRLVRPEEVASAVLFLASDQAEMISGETILIDGGAP